MPGTRAPSPRTERKGEHHCDCAPEIERATHGCAGALARAPSDNGLVSNVHDFFRQSSRNGTLRCP